MIKKRNIKLSILFMIFLFNLFFGIAWTSTDKVYFNAGGDIACYKNTNIAKWLNFSALLLDEEEYIFVFNSSGNVGNCSLFYREINGSCCPIGMSCNITNGQCYQNPKNYCEELKTREECENPLNSIERGTRTFQELQLPGFETCGEEESFYDSLLRPCVNKTICKCYWRNSKCEPKRDIEEECLNMDGDIGLINNKSCKYETTVTNNCGTKGEIEVFYKARVEPIGETMTNCVDYTKKYSCEEIATVPFFSLKEFFLSFVLIISLTILFLKIKK